MEASLTSSINSEYNFKQLADSPKGINSAGHAINYIDDDNEDCCCITLSKVITVATLLIFGSALLFFGTTALFGATFAISALSWLTTALALKTSTVAGIYLGVGTLSVVAGSLIWVNPCAEENESDL